MSKTMRYFIIYIVIVLCSINIFAQKQKITVGFSYSPDVNFHNIENISGGIIGDIIVTEARRNTAPMLSFSMCASVILKKMKHLSLETGLSYSKKGFQQNYMNLVFAGPDPLDDVKKIKHHNFFHYLNLPIKANFIFGKKKLKFLTSIGVTTNFLLNKTDKSVYIRDESIERKKFHSNEKFKNINISPSVGLGCDYTINTNSIIRLMPNFSYGIIKIIDAPVTAYLYNTGIQIGYYKNL